MSGLAEKIRSKMLLLGNLSAHVLSPVKTPTTGMQCNVPMAAGNERCTSLPVGEKGSSSWEVIPNPFSCLTLSF